MLETLSAESVLEVLKPVQDPELQKSLVALNMIRNVSIADGNVRFTLVLTTPACPLRQFIVEDCERAVKTLPGVKSIEVEVTVMDSVFEIFESEEEALSGSAAKLQDIAPAA